MDIASVFILLFILFIILILWGTLIPNRYDKCLSGFPGPRTLPFIGNALDIGSSSKLLHNLLKFNKEYGGIFKTRIGNFYGLTVTDRDFLEFILSSNTIITKANTYRYLFKWLGTGLITATGTKWKTHRKLLTPAFHFKILEQFINSCDLTTNILVEKLSIHLNSTSFDICSSISLCTLDIICETSMGTSVKAQDDKDSCYVKSVKEMCRIAMSRAYNPFKMFKRTYQFTKDYHKEQESLKVLHHYTNSVITERKNGIPKDIINGTKELDETGIKQKLTFLDILLEVNVDGQYLTQEEIRQEVDTFLFAGHDTTATAVSFALYELSLNQDIQNLAYEEQKSIFDDDMHRAITYRDLCEMKYLEQVIKEALRLYPSVPMYARCLTEDVEYKGETLPKGLLLCLFPFGLHRNQMYYPNPDVFDPNRFGEYKKKEPFTYLPFSAGPRNCIGQRFAMLIMKMMLSKILKNYEILPASPYHNLQLVVETVLVSKNGVKVGMRQRVN